MINQQFLERWSYGNRYLDNQRDMIAMASQWFSSVDDASHIYCAYSDDPKTDNAFASFKADCSDHLKLLYCIDMLNEGIPVDGVDGVILLRPTVSPIIYKQQIVNEHFRVIDEARDCMELFEKLNDSLTASWSLMYHYAESYAGKTAFAWVAGCPRKKPA